MKLCWGKSVDGRDVVHELQKHTQEGGEEIHDDFNAQQMVQPVSHF